MRYATRPLSQTQPLKVLSLGAGVQSSALALMSAAGVIERFDAAIFADTGNEPRAVMEYLAMLKARLPFPVHRVSVGNLAEDFLAALRGERSRCSQPPYFVKALPGPDPRAGEIIPVKRGEDEFQFMAEVEARRPDYSLRTDEGGMLWRGCTRDYKIVPIQRQIRELLRMSQRTHALQYIGISLDEIGRMKPSGVKYIRNEFPLIDLAMTRTDCLKWIEAAGLPRPPKSACWHCPYRSNNGWLAMKEQDPESFELACTLDESMRAAKATKINGAGITGEPFVWRGFAPLRTADFGKDPAQGEFAIQAECEGMCGL